MQVLKTKEELTNLFIRACCEQGWRNGMLQRLAECIRRFPDGGKTLSSVSGIVGDYFDAGWLKKLKEKENVVIDESLRSKEKVYY